MSVWCDFRWGSFGFITPGQYWVHLKAPWAKPLFSERYGYEKPRIKFLGWRLWARPVRPMREFM